MNPTITAADSTPMVGEKYRTIVVHVKMASDCSGAAQMLTCFTWCTKLYSEKKLLATL